MQQVNHQLVSEIEEEKQQPQQPQTLIAQTQAANRVSQSQSSNEVK
jgi:hypothetical protein